MIPAARILVVDDSAFMRLALRRIIEAEADLRVVGEASDGLLGVETAARLRPEVVVMDLVMPHLDGIEATRRIMALPSPPAVIVVSAHTRDGSEAVRAALAEGAVDCLWKNSDLGGADLARLDRELRPRLRRLAAERRREGGSEEEPAPIQGPIQSPVHSPGRVAVPEVVVVGASTGGPDAIAAFLQGCGPLPVPCVVAQHMPPGLAPEMAASLARRLGRPVLAGADGMRLTPGAVVLLPGDGDGVLTRDGDALSLRLAHGGGLLRPSVNALFRSAAEVARGAVGVVLTGMGQDGLEGAAALSARGMAVLAQQPASCVVQGMPRAVIAAGLAKATAAPEALGAQVLALLSPAGRPS